MARPSAAELEAALVRGLVTQWAQLNVERFRSAMRAPAFELDDAEQRLAAWVPARRAITVSRQLLAAWPWVEVREVLAHEMAHQYVHEVLKVRDETAHGPAFHDVCRRFHVDERAAGRPRVPTTSSDAHDRLSRRVRKLLALAESPNANEAEAAAAAARRLLLRYKLETTPRDHTFRQLGPVEARVPEHRRLLASLLTRHYFVSTIWVPALDARTGATGRALEAVGTPENLEMAAYVHEFLLETAWRLWKAHAKAARLSGDRARLRYTSGVIAGFGEKLAAEVDVCAREEGLVWVGDPGVEVELRRLHPRVRTVRYGAGQDDAVRRDGRAAGRGIVLHRPVAAGPGGEIRRIGRRDD
jgi:hypothetical protein